MRPQRIYTIPELAELTGRPYAYWDRECREGRLGYLQPHPRAGRLVPQELYEQWVDQSFARLIEPPAEETAAPDTEFAFAP